MTKLVPIVSATIVVFLLCLNAEAAPIGVIVDATPGRPEQKVLKQNENMSISQPGPLPEGALSKPLPDYYPFRQALTIRLGQSAPLNDTKDTDTFVGFSYMFPAFLSPHFEAGSDVQSRGDKGHIHANIRMIFRERRILRPSLTLGVGHMVEASEALASFANYRNYFLRSGAAIDLSYGYNWSGRLELEIFLGAKDYYVAPSLGLVRNW